MKRFLYMMFVVFILVGIGAPVFASDGYYSYYEINAVRKFRATGIVTEDLTNPLYLLQNRMDFEFVDGRNVSRTYTLEQYADQGWEAGIYTLALDLTYDKELFESYQAFFINGNFTYSLETDNGTMEIEGVAQGRLIGNDYDYTSKNNVESNTGTFAIALDCYSEDNTWAYTFFLSTPNTQLASLTEQETDSSYRGYYSHEERPHIPTPSKPGDVAAGVGITTAGIVLVNALTNTSVFGSAPFNSTFNPQASPSAQPGTGGISAASGTSASSGIASAAQGSAVSSAQGASITGSGNFLKGILDFFRSLFDTLRDMLTDEGRSYASGKVTDLLSDSDLGDISGGN